MITQEEAEAVRFEFNQLVEQKEGLHGVKKCWNEGKRKRLQALCKIMDEYERQTVDIIFFLRDPKFQPKPKGQPIVARVSHALQLQLL